LGSFAIQTQELTKRYGATTAVNGLTVSVKAGSIFGLLGPNGSGKSTTVRMLCGLLPPSAGTATVNGMDIVGERRAVRWSIGYMAQAFAMYGDLTAWENIEFYGRAYGLSSREVRLRASQMVERTGISRYLQTRTHKLSGGWQRRLALVCAVLHDPPVVFLDEPTAGIDPSTRRDLWDLFVEMAQTGKTFFVTTHSLDEAERCSGLGYLDRGTLVACGSPQEVRRAAVGLQPGRRWFAIATPDLIGVCGAAAALSFVHRATIAGGAVRVTAREECTCSRLAEGLAGRVAPADIVEVEPSLEDLFAETRP
jgi:ABC-type multidrug transport system ATPase subunit